MTPIKRPMAAAGAAVLLSLSLSACGGYPTDASKKDFCAALGDIAEVSSSIEGDEPTEKEWERIQGSYEDLGDVGTPDGIGEDERNGFEVIVDAITDLDYDEAKKSFGEEDGSDDIPGVSKDEEKDAEKFFTYAGTTCADELSDSGSDSDSDSGSDSGSDDGSDSASDLPSVDPSDLPSFDPNDLSPEDLESLQSELEKFTESAATQ